MVNALAKMNHGPENASDSQTVRQQE